MILINTDTFEVIEADVNEVADRGLPDNLVPADDLSTTEWVAIMRKALAHGNDSTS